MPLDLKDCAKMIDHSLLHPTMTDDILERECAVAKKYECASVCIKPYAIPLATESLKGSSVKVDTVIGFPHGNSTIAIKEREAAEACKAGAVEIDMVINIGKALGGDWDYVSSEIKAINDAVTAKGARLKVIFETDFLEDSHIIKLCEICSLHKTAFVKTSTGYGFVKGANGFYSYLGATQHNLRLMRKYSAPEVEVKAAGGVRTLEGLLKVHSWGATRVGATATAKILDEAKSFLDSGKALEDLI